jgi:hypothetical protein
MIRLRRVSSVNLMVIPTAWGNKLRRPYSPHLTSSSPRLCGSPKVSREARHFLRWGSRAAFGNPSLEGSRHHTKSPASPQRSATLPDFRPPTRRRLRRGVGGSSRAWPPRPRRGFGSPPATPPDRFAPGYVRAATRVATSSTTCGPRSPPPTSIRRHAPGGRDAIRTGAARRPAYGPNSQAAPARSVSSTLRCIGHRTNTRPCRFGHTSTAFNPLEQVTGLPGPVSFLCGCGPSRFCPTCMGGNWRRGRGSRSLDGFGLRSN